MAAGPGALPGLRVIPISASRPWRVKSASQPLPLVASMRIPFSEKPGRHERHFRRRLDNELFPTPLRNPGDDDLLEVQRLDHEELIGFLTQLRETVHQAVELKPNEESQTILDLKERLDKLYEQSAGLADDQAGNQEALRQLIAVIMKTLWAAATDPQAESELEQETTARTTHFELLREPLVADLLHPDSAIGEDELVPTLLTESESAVAAAVTLFDEDQLSLLIGEANALLDAKDPHATKYPKAPLRLKQLEAALLALQPKLAIN